MFSAADALGIGSVTTFFYWLFAFLQLGGVMPSRRDGLEPSVA